MDANDFITNVLGIIVTAYILESIYKWFLKTYFWQEFLLLLPW